MNPRSPRRDRRRAIPALVLAILALVGGAGGIASGAVAQPTVATEAPRRAAVDPAILEAVDAAKPATFYVVLRDKADLSTTRRGHGHAARARATYDALRGHATRSQRPVTALLDRERVGYRSFWLTNAVRVTTADRHLVETLAARPDVAELVRERRYPLDRVVAASGSAPNAGAGPVSGLTASPAAVVPEWGITDVRADEVWAQYGDTGEGIVIANIDSGVDYDHPSLVESYRGNLGDGAFAHDYNFFDPIGQCTNGVPCDNNGHGTHTMGTMAGADGVGVAPGATWIAAKGCEARSCSDASLLAAGQWTLAPTDRNGQNPRPDLAPHIVNNSWGGGDTTFYQDIVEACNAAGIFEAFAAGNDGDGVTCSTAHAPGSQAPAYGVGAYGADGKIAGFSGFGPSLVDGSMKPNIAAPGVAVRSAWPGTGYRSLNGTSMATPHVAGAVALLWAEAPSLIGDIAGTRALLDRTARNVADTHCGGTADRNNVWGEGKLDALAAVDAAPHTAAVISGTVTDRATGAPIPNASVTASSATMLRSVRTGAEGAYRLTLPAGTYTLDLSAYGFADLAMPDYEVTSGGDAVRDFGLDAVSRHVVTGTVLDVSGAPLAGVAVRIADTPVPAVATDATGRFRFPAVAEGDFTLGAEPAAPALCNGDHSGPLAVDGDEDLTVALPNRTDVWGNSCAPVGFRWVKGDTRLPLTGDEDAHTLALPFPVELYGVGYTTASVTTNGLVNFLQPRLGDYHNTALPAPGQPNGIVAAFWDDLVLDKRSSVQTALTGTPGARRFTIAWNNAALADAPASRVSFQVLLDEASGAITLQFKDIDDNPLERGSSATVGLEDQGGTDALEYSFGHPVLADGSAIRFARKAA
ncbi:S8 family serine peptidase [Nocardioides speluncae]|uniref:S8 family serine peptidase n=1 Tax=Nocardioides speluncae TaxID=2670337 RepID=UPI000D6957F4|nr:S8 family serine peptidase [Nocardioides speluncae]